MRFDSDSRFRLLFVVSLGVYALPVAGGGIRLPDQDAFATARGEAFVATADTPAAIYYNPAGITQLEGNNFRLGMYGIYLAPNYTSPSGRSFDNQNPWHAMPHLFYTLTPQDSRFSFGLGAYAPYGLGLSWAQDSGFRTLGLSSSLDYFTLNPVVAFKILPNLSVAAGMTANYADVELRQGMLWPAQPLDQLSFEGNGWALGYNLGVRWEPIEQIALGASFRSRTSMEMQGHTEYYNAAALPLPTGGAVPAFPQQQVSANANFPFPLNAIFGISYRPTPKWNLEFDADYADWSSFGTVTINQGAPFPPLLPKNLPLTFDWQPSWYYELGATRYLGKGWSVSAGYIFNQSSVPDAHYSPLVADVDKHFFSVGTGFRGQRFDFDIAYQFGYGPSHTVSGSAPSATGQNADGAYEFLSHAVAISVGWHF